MLVDISWRLLRQRIAGVEEYINISKNFVMRCILPVNAGACLSPKDELAQEHERIGYRLEGEEYFIVKPALSPL